mgnify:CR=1 FL=1
MSLKNRFLHSSYCSMWDQVSSFLTFFEIQKQWLQKKEISRAIKLCLDNSEELLKRYILSVKLFSVIGVSLRGLAAKVNSWWCDDFIVNYCFHILASRRYLVDPRHLTRSTNCRRELSTSFVYRPAMMLEPGHSRMLCPSWLHRNHPMLLKVGVPYTLGQTDIFPRSSSG